MGHRLRAVLGVPVGFVGCNWGGTPAAAWTAAEELDAVPALQAVLDWHSRACAELDWPKYEADALHPDKDPPPEQREMLDALMMVPICAVWCRGSISGSLTVRCQRICWKMQ